jgi:hypothetical protein
LKDLRAQRSKSVEEPLPPPPSDEQRLADLAQRLADKYPHATFDFTDLDPDLLEPVADQIDSLFQAYPQVAQAIPYVGAGNNAPQGYEPDWEGKHRRSLAFVRRNTRTSEAYAPMFLNPRYFSNPDFTEQVLERLAASSWHVGDSLESVVTHEFGHVVDAYLEQNGRDHSVFGYINQNGVGEISKIIKMFKETHKRLGDTISGYAEEGGPREAFAEAFAAIHFQPEAEWNGYTRKLKGLLDLLLPDGSSASWEAPTRTKLTQAQFKQWLAFYKEFLTEDEEEES